MAVAQLPCEADLALMLLVLVCSCCLCLCATVLWPRVAHGDVSGAAGHLDSIAEMVGASRVPVVTVAFGQPARRGGGGGDVDTGEPAPSRQALPDLLTAICMLRVLRRTNHTGTCLSPSRFRRLAPVVLFGSEIVCAVAESAAV